MADDLDGVNQTSPVRQYNPGDQYRVRETDPDEASGGRDFYDGFMRKKKQQQNADDKPEERSAEQSPQTPENPIPVVEQLIHDDVILSSRARQLIGQAEAPTSGNPLKIIPPEPSIPIPPATATPGHIQVKA